MRKHICFVMKNQKGAALITTMIALIVLSILGTVFIFSMTTEGRQSIEHGNKTNAYYLARSGAEAVYVFLIDEHKNGNLESFIESNPTIYGDLEEGGLKVDTSNNSFDEENVMVKLSATYKDNGDFDVITITSTGHKEGQKREVNVELFSPEFIFSSLQLYNGSFDLPSDINSYPNVVKPQGGWTQGASGVIAGSHGSLDESVRFDGPGNSSRLNQGKDGDNNTWFFAKEIYFMSPFTVHSGYILHIKADLILFDNVFRIQENGGLCLHASNGDSVFRFKAGLEYDGDEILDDNAYVIPAGGKVCFPLDDMAAPLLSEWPQKWE